MNTNHRILGMESHIAYGVCFILPIVALAALLVDRDMERENKLFMWEALIGWAAAFVGGALTFFIAHILAWIIHAVMIFFGVLNLTGRVTHLPFADKLAEMIVK